MALAEMVFGRNIAHRAGVTDIDFANFAAAEITPRFPDGLTILDGSGQWRDAARGIHVQERAKVLRVTFDDSAQKRADLASIAESYKRRFSQQSVLLQISDVCASF